VSRTNEVIRASQADGAGMPDRLADFSSETNFRQAWSVTVVRGPHRSVANTLGVRSKETKEIATADVARPPPLGCVAAGVHHQGTHIGDRAIGLCLSGFETNAFTPGTDRTLAPVLIATPADEAELSVRCRWDPAPMSVAER